MPSQAFSHEATADAPVEAVWARLDEPETWGSIGGVHRVSDPKLDPEGRLVGFSFDTFAAGRKYVGTATPHERVEGKRMAWNIRNRELRGVTSVTLNPTDSGTIVNVTLHVESVGMLSSMLFPVIAAAIGRGLPTAVERFAAGPFLR